jgi:hypothetical protein
MRKTTRAFATVVALLIAAPSLCLYRQQELMLQLEAVFILVFLGDHKIDLLGEKLELEETKLGNFSISEHS